MSLHTRLNTIKDIEKHQIANEIEKFQRVRFCFHWVICFFLSIILCQYIYKIDL